MEKLKKITEKLLDIGGNKVLIPESITKKLINLGHLYCQEVIIPLEGASKYYLRNENDVRIIWGFVLDDNGIWKMHSWLIDKRTYQIIDNKIYAKYYGFVK